MSEKKSEHCTMRSTLKVGNYYPVAHVVGLGDIGMESVDGVMVLVENDVRMTMMNKNNRKLLFTVSEGDCRFDYYRGKGKGGQKKNVTDNCVRCTHEESGAVGKSENGRSQRKNKEMAFKKMSETNEFKHWHRMETARLMGTMADIDSAVERSMRDIKIEGKEDGRWKVL